MKTIGVFGGLGPQATMDFETRVHRAAQRLIPQKNNFGYPPMIVYFYRSAPMRLDDRHAPIVPLEPDPKMFEAVARLRGMADFLVIPSNTPHLFREGIEKAAGCPLLSIIETTLAEIERRGLQRVGVLGHGEPKVYTEPLGQRGVATEVLASRDEMDLRGHIDDAIRALMEGRMDPQVPSMVRRAIDILRARDVQAVVLACSELPLMLGSHADEAADLINPTELLAEAAVRRAMA
jgi:aspartate racemase